jgi:hypothetical protein
MKNTYTPGAVLGLKKTFYVTVSPSALRSLRYAMKNIALIQAKGSRAVVRSLYTLPTLEGMSLDSVDHKQWSEAVPYWLGVPAR